LSSPCYRLHLVRCAGGARVAIHWCYVMCCRNLRRRGDVSRQIGRMLAAVRLTRFNSNESFDGWKSKRDFIAHKAARWAEISLRPESRARRWERWRRGDGAAIELRSALLVNPYDAESVANALSQALAMPLEERRARHDVLLAAISEYDVERWQREFLAALRGDDSVRDEFPVPTSPTIPRRGRLASARPGTAAARRNPAVKV